MSSRLLEIGLTNAALALLISLMVVAVVRWRPNAQWEAALWLVALIKFVVPPLVPFPVTVQGPVATIASPESSAPTDAAIARSPSPAPAGNATEKFATSRAPAPQSVAARAAASDQSNGVTKPSSSSPATHVGAPNFFAMVKHWLWPYWNIRSIAWIWLGGAVLAALVLTTRAHRFSRIVCGAGAQQPDAELEIEFRQLCQRTGIRRRPWLRVIDAEVSPLIWSWFGPTIVLLPQSLMGKLTREQRSMVLAHELAHIRRHDHLFRWLEAIVQSLYWWFPPVRWIRRRLHAAQEQCCDAFVIDQFPDRQAEYCDALFAAANWMALARKSPILASEFGRSDTLKHRIHAVLQQRLARPLTNKGRSLCLAIGLLLLAVSVHWVIAASKEAPKPKNERTQTTTQFLVTDAEDRPVAAGEAHVKGYTQMGDFFEETFPIKQGKAIVPLKSPQLDQMTVQLDAPGYLSHFKEYRRGKDQPFFAVAGQYKFQLKPGIAIGGKIVDADRQPVAKARVYAYSSAGGAIEAGFDAIDKTVYTNAAGEWEMSGAPAGLGVTLYVERTKGASGGINFTVLPEQFAALRAHRDVRTLPEAPTVSGTVVDPAGKPVQGAMVLLRGRNFYRDYRRNIPLTDASGSFSITAVPPGNHLVTFFSLDWALKSVKFSVPLKEPLKIVMQKGKRVEFRTVDEQGKPISGVRFHPQPPLNSRYDGDAQVLDFLGNRDLIKNRSDSRGIFVWENAPSEPLGYQIASARVLMQPQGDYGPAGSPHTLIFRDRIPVHAKVVDAATGELIKSYRIYEGTHFKVNQPGLWSWNLQSPSRAKPGGFDDSLKGQERLIRYRIQADGYRLSISDVLDAQKLPDKPVLIEFRLQKDNGYSAAVRSPDGQPAAGAKVYTAVKRRGDYRSREVLAGVANQATAATVTTADVEGAMRIAPSSDPFLCFISHESGYAELMDVDLFQNSKITLVPWGKIDGVLWREGKPAANIAVQLRKDDVFAIDSELPGVSYSARGKTDAAGKYSFDRCVAGQWNETIVYEPARAQAAFGYQTILTVDIAPGQTLSQHFGTEGADLHGRVSVPKGVAIDWDKSRAFLTYWEQRTPPDPATKLPKAFREIARRRDLLTLSKDGSFRFINLEPAEYDLAFALVVPGDNSNRPTYSKKITITREMFLRKTPTNPIDLGEVPLAAAR
jgi:beta-lactamase regulating signal transducer with metallopeptidase domain/uncharacterized GH25 family protein